MGEKMGKVYHNITELVGHTPLLQLERIEEKYETQAHIFSPNWNVIIQAEA